MELGEDEGKGEAGLQSQYTPDMKSEQAKTLLSLIYSSQRRVDTLGAHNPPWLFLGGADVISGSTHGRNKHGLCGLPFSSSVRVWHCP